MFTHTLDRPQARLQVQKYEFQVLDVSFDIISTNNWRELVCAVATTVEGNHTSKDVATLIEQAINRDDGYASLILRNIIVTVSFHDRD